MMVGAVTAPDCVFLGSDDIKDAYRKIPVALTHQCFSVIASIGLSALTQPKTQELWRKSMGPNSQ
eukprot:2703873-Amphidinium_carterae.1